MDWCVVGSPHISSRRAHKLCISDNNQCNGFNFILPFTCRININVYQNEMAVHRSSMNGNLIVSHKMTTMTWDWIKKQTHTRIQHISIERRMENFEVPHMHRSSSYNNDKLSISPLLICFRSESE